MKEKSSRRRGVFGSALLLLSIGGLALACTQAAGASTIAQEKQKACIAAVVEGVHAIQIAIQSWAVDNNDTYPPNATVSKAGLHKYVSHWPVNPYTNRPMVNAKTAGNFYYAVDSKHFTYKLLGFVLKNGKLMYFTAN